MAPLITLTHSTHDIRHGAGVYVYDDMGHVILYPIYIPIITKLRPLCVP